MTPPDRQGGGMTLLERIVWPRFAPMILSSVA